MNAGDGKKYTIPSNYVDRLVKLNYDPVAGRKLKYDAKGFDYLAVKEDQVKAGDIVIFYNAKGQCIHSCIMKKVEFAKDKSIDVDKSTVSTKNGIAPLELNAVYVKTILLEDYRPATILYFRPK